MSHLASLLRRPSGGGRHSISVTCETIYLTLILLQYSPLAHLRSEVLFCYALSCMAIYNFCVLCWLLFIYHVH